MAGVTKTGGTGSTKFTGTSQDDIYFGTTHDSASETLTTGGGDDLVYAGSGDDFVQAGTGDDIVSGGAGNDLLSGGDGNDVVLGGAGNDVIAGDNGDDILSGGSGADIFQYKANFGHDTILDFEDGVDKLNFYVGTIAGETHVQSFTSIGALVSYASTHGLSVDTTGYSDLTISGFTGGSLTFVGAASPTGNKPHGTSGDDVLISDGTGHNVGGDGDDTVYAGGASVNIEGNAGDDILIGGADNDRIGGQAGDDIIFGGLGNDVISGGAGNDIVSGDEGGDTFLFTAATLNNDTITDLNFAEGDKIDFFAGTFGATQTAVIQIDSVDDLKSLMASHSGDPSWSVDVGNAVTQDRVILHMGAGHDLTLIGLASEWV